MVGRVACVHLGSDLEQVAYPGCPLLILALFFVKMKISVELFVSVPTHHPRIGCFIQSKILTPVGWNCWFTANSQTCLKASECRNFNCTSMLPRKLFVLGTSVYWDHMKLDSNIIDKAYRLTFYMPLIQRLSYLVTRVYNQKFYYHRIWSTKWFCFAFSFHCLLKGKNGEMILLIFERKYFNR